MSSAVPGSLDELPTRGVIYTVGHSSLTHADFLALLIGRQIRLLADIRRFPASRRCPWFSQAALREAAEAVGIEYRWFQTLGGYRGPAPADSPNTGLHSPGFRSYADYMRSAEFRAAADELMGLAANKTTAYMCAERLYFRCHRVLLSDFLPVGGWQVLHILGPGTTKPHRLTNGLRVEGGNLLYLPAETSLFS